MAITFDKVAKLIIITKPTTSVTIQNLINAIRDYEDEQENLEVARIANATGKEDLGGGVQVGITLELLDGWQVQFEERTVGEGWTICNITGGNLVALNEVGANQFPLYPSDYVNGWITTSSSATISSLEIENVQRIIESVRPYGRSYFGNIYWWNPASGTDGLDGLSRQNAVKTFAAAHDLVTDGGHDIIIAIPEDGAAQTVVTEAIEISKKYVSVRGPGKNFKIKPALIGNDTVTITADGVELMNMVIETADSGSRDAIVVSGANYVSLENIWIEKSVGIGLKISNGVDCRLKNVRAHSIAGDGFQVGSNTTHLNMFEVHADSSSTGHGINISGSNIKQVEIEGPSELYQNAGYGVNIGSGVINVSISDEVNITANLTGEVNDLGTNTVYGGTVGGEATASAVWDAAIANHTSVGTTGKALKDARDAAEVAMIKK